MLITKEQIYNTHAFCMEELKWMILQETFSWIVSIFVPFNLSSSFPVFSSSEKLCWPKVREEKTQVIYP